MILNSHIHVLVLVLCILSTQGYQKQTEANLDFDIQKDPNEKYYKANVKDEEVVDMYQKWVDTGISSLMSAIANHKLKRQRRTVIQEYGQCSSKATNIPKHATCLTKLLNNKFKPTNVRRTRYQRLQKYKKEEKVWTGGFKTDQSNNAVLLPKKQHDTNHMVFRSKRNTRIKESSSYHINSNKEQLTPMGHIAKMLMESVKSIKGKDNLPQWQETVSKLRSNGAKRKKYKKLIEDDSEENMNQMQMHALKDKMIGNKPMSTDEDLEDALQDPQKLRKYVKDKKVSKTREDKILDVVKSGLKLMYSLAGENTTNFEDKNMKLVSPRFLGLVPEEKQDNEISLISPSLFSLHDQGEGIENLTSLPNLLKGFSKKDQQLWLDIIMEAAGVNDESEKLEQDVHDFEFNKTRSAMTNITNLVDEHGTPYYATKENVTQMGTSPEYVEMFEKLHQNYTKDQLREMNTTGYAILNKHQIELLYGPESPHSDPETYKRLMQMTEDQIHHHLHKDFEVISQHDRLEIDQQKFRQAQQAEHRRKKRQLLPGIVLSPVLNTPVVLSPLLASQPFILSPVVLTPLILSPSVFGAIILSPWLFVPVILSPRILGALVLSPFAFSPLILSPFALHPAVLSPGIFSPIVLSPFLLLPLILSPQVFTPIILSPLCLAPVILTPMVGSPLILSPFVLSPIIASPLGLSALVLSPYALSPVIWSPLIVFVAILSPSWLS
ncbi:unnamed protein product [Bursaphelenchus okinawaensis]|uniref:Uncharacterized protein n=1 Tax=Bursaphelenchus okinawaensis TaxID=465554 RepID=A0A811K5D4_9BILA|nr:unnamed protein product [Bursaphelenchus okinawaensis]CAG9091713.1 unnamed protein product [Bursaphelenchus okinawaensis]